MKWLLPNTEMTPTVPDGAGDFRDAWFSVVVGGDLPLRIHRPRGWMTPADEPRETWLVTGDRLGGYVGLSRSEDSWHIGTPAERPSPVLIALAVRRGWQPL